MQPGSLSLQQTGKMSCLLYVLPKHRRLLIHVVSARLQLKLLAIMQEDYQGNLCGSSTLESEA